MLIYGLHSGLAALQNPHRQIKAIYCSSYVARKLGTLKKAKRHILERGALKKLVGHGEHQGLVIEATPLPPAPYEGLAWRFVLILDMLEDPRNIGTILRLAAAMGVDGILAPKAHFPTQSSAMVKAACGAYEKLRPHLVSNLARGIDQLKKDNFWVIGLENDAPQPLPTYNFPPRTALCVGQESRGLRHRTVEKLDISLAIPTSHESSINVAQATAIGLYAYRSQYPTDNMG